MELDEIDIKVGRDSPLVVDYLGLGHQWVSSQAKQLLLSFDIT